MQIPPNPLPARTRELAITCRELLVFVHLLCCQFFSLHLLYRLASDGLPTSANAIRSKYLMESTYGRAGQELLISIFLATIIKLPQLNYAKIITTTTNQKCSKSKNKRYKKEHIQMLPVSNNRQNQIFIQHLDNWKNINSRRIIKLFQIFQACKYHNIEEKLS